MAKARKKILVVDDNPVTQKLYRCIFENAGYEVQGAYSGEECLKSVAGSAPNIILMDVILPDIDGKVVVERINNQEKTRDVPVIFVTNTLSAEKDKGYETISIAGRDYRAFEKPRQFFHKSLESRLVSRKSFKNRLFFRDRKMGE